MALIHRISDAIHLHTDTDKSGNPVIEIEFRFVRYMLVIDDKTKAEKLFELLKQVLSKGGVEPKKDLPPFYKTQ